MKKFLYYVANRKKDRKRNQPIEWGGYTKDKNGNREYYNRYEKKIQEIENNKILHLEGKILVTCPKTQHQWWVRYNPFTDDKAELRCPVRDCRALIYPQRGRGRPQSRTTLENRVLKISKGTIYQKVMREEVFGFEIPGCEMVIQKYNKVFLATSRWEEKRLCNTIIKGTRRYIEGLVQLKCKKYKPTSSSSRCNVECNSTDYDSKGIGSEKAWRDNA